MRGVSPVLAALTIFTVSFGLTGCATAGSRQLNNASEGALVGSLLGAGLGAVIGHQSGEAGEGAAIGAAAGAVGGYLLGNEQDKVELQSETALAMQSANTVVINVKNSNGSVTPVALSRQGNVYVGPKGEYYTHLPTEEQLRPVYGF